MGIVKYWDWDRKFIVKEEVFVDEVVMRNKILRYLCCVFLFVMFDIIVFCESFVMVG